MARHGTALRCEAQSRAMPRRVMTHHNKKTQISYTFSWKLMTLLPEMAGSWGLHLISMTSSSGNLSPGSIGNRIVTHIHNSWSFWQWVTPQADILDKSMAKIPSTLVRVIRHSVGSKLFPATLSKTGALTKLVGKRKKAVKVSFVAVFMQWMSARKKKSVLLWWSSLAWIMIAILWWSKGAEQHHSKGGDHQNSATSSYYSS